ncbi:FAD-dependent oxidoreductase [Paraburkholderia sabiae]|uniref:FAD-dependent oxidoreductase n=1 Tax=Paraburkholderia sabiae TaxID=273251 RepID=A0ABU9QD12_9BURK|nr:FAD-dependent oxidoreductase [Paraburkholderia sabiae]WJZ76087.1 FAD-dependent oxidoreductase [Paraburkholderia sabiae]CAD6526830.1 3-phenylpropionate/cinnamic acid dioxygenase ferredoxin--NAD(+) reductase component [Paraburkholderia sabiae]
MTTNTTMQKAARLSDLADNGMKRIEADGTPILLIRRGHTVHAYSADCPHAGAPLEQGALCDGRLICPWHKGTFDIATGALVEPPALLPLTRYPVRIEHDDVLVGSTPEPSETKPATAADQRTFAIVGAGAAGAAACAALREAGFAGRIALIDREPRTPYDRTVLSKFVPSGEMPVDDIPPLLPDDFFAKHGVDRIQAEVTTLDAKARRIDIGSAPSIRYDAALVATGGIPKRLTLQGSEADSVKPRIRLLRNRDDARRLVETAQQGEHALVLGASFVGLEVASALRERKLRVTVVSPGNVPFEKQFGPELGRLFMRLHEAHGVKVRMGRQARSVEPGDADGDGALRVTLDNGDTVSCDFIVAGIGVTPATDFLDGVTRNEDKSLNVDSSMRVKDGPDGLYAAGDIARFELQAPVSERVRIEHWRVAQQQARIAAHAMLGMPPKEPLVPFFWTYHFGKTFEYLGHAKHWDETRFTGTPDTFEFIALLGDKGKLVAAVGCNREKQTGMLVEALRKPLTLDDATKIAESA